jgi:hypothetical protein
MRKLLFVALIAISSGTFLVDWRLDALAASPVAICGLSGTSGQSNCVIPNSDGSINTTPASGGSQTVAGATTAADDAALTLMLKTYSLMGLYDGAAVDMAREVTNGMNSTGAGIPITAGGGQCDDTSPTALSENSWGNGRVDCTTHGQYVERLPTASSTAGIAAVVSGSLETGHVLKNAAGSLYSVEVATTSAAGYMLVFNSTTVPSAGAVTPVAVCYVPAFGTCALNFDPPLVLATGISVGFSIATTPFTKTDSATAFISGQVM